MATDAVTSNRRLKAAVVLLTLALAGSLTSRFWVPTVKEGIGLVRANLNMDLRDHFVRPGDRMRHTDREALEKNTRIEKCEAGLQLWRSPIGDFWMPPNEGIEALREMAEVIQQDTYNYRGRTVRAGDVVIDCGAHLGSFTRKALDRGASLVLAIEPSAAKITCLRKTFAREIEEGKVRVLQLAVWNRDDKLWLPGPPTMLNSLVQNSLPGEGVGEWVDVTTLDKIVKDQGLAKVDFIKMDIEGAEVNALRGAAQTITRDVPFLAIAVEHTEDLAQNARNVIRTVNQFGQNYHHGFGRYGRANVWAPYSPWEIFFYQ